MSSRYVHTASVNHIDSIYIDRLSWHPAPANHNRDLFQARLKPSFWYHTLPSGSKETVSPV